MKRLLFFIIAGAALGMLPFLGAYPIFIMKIMCYALFACAFNLLIGYAGLLSFGHAAFFGSAGYAAGHAIKIWGFSPELGILYGTLIAALVGLVMGLLAIRRSGIYFTMITLALSQMVFFFFLQAPFTGGEDGLQGVPRGQLFGLIDLHNDLNLYFVVILIFLAGYFACWRIVRSPFGQALQAIKTNEQRCVSLGYNTDRFKLIIFILSATISGLAGATKSLVFVSATLSDAQWQMSGMVVLMTLIGGMGTFFGPVIGALIVVSLENKIGDIGSYLAKTTNIEWFGSMGESVGMIMGAIFILCVMAFRRGIVGEILKLRRTKQP